MNNKKLIKWMFLLVGLIISGLIFISALIYFLASRGMPEAEVFIGVLHKEGYLLHSPGNEHAKKWLLKAANKNSAQGQCVLGEIFESEKEYSQAAYWYLKAALNNMPRCQYDFGRLYSQGLGIERNEKAAFIWTKKAADNGNSYAEYAAAIHFLKGDVVPKDTSTGLEYLIRSANQENPSAQGYLGLIYFKGELLTRNLNEAEKWAKRAKRNGDDNTEYLLNEIAKLN